MNAVKTPKTLLEVIRTYADEQSAFAAAKSWRWPDGKVVCPRCQSEKVHLIESRRVWRCNGCKRQFSVKVGTIFEDSPISFTKWIPAMWLLANCKNGISSYELHRALGVTQKTAWFMLHRIRLAMQDDSVEMLGGHVEADETYIGGKARNMHKADRERRIGDGTGFKGKTAVMGVLERGGPVQAFVIQSATKKTVEPILEGTVMPKSTVYTDALLSYKDIDTWFKHQVIDHGIAYVEGQIHTNGLENFWSLLKRGIRGTYVSVEPFHLFRYLDEQVYRYNARKMDDGFRFREVASSVVGKRLTYKQLTGKELAAG